MYDNRLTSLISLLFAEDRKKHGIAPNKVKKALADLWEKVGNVHQKRKETKNEQSKNCRTGEKSANG